MNLSLNGELIELDKNGYLVNLEDWSRDVATLLAQEENISLTAEHWEIIDALRTFYQEYQISPAMRALVKYIERELGQEKGRSIYLLGLFPPSPAKIASKIAGLPRPTNCL